MIQDPKEDLKRGPGLKRSDASVTYNAGTGNETNQMNHPAFAAIPPRSVGGLTASVIAPGGPSGLESMENSPRVGVSTIVQTCDFDVMFSYLYRSILA